MDSLASVALKYIESENKYKAEDRDLYHYNCAEVILNSCNDYYDLKANHATLRAIIPFGGGMYSESTCGILTGGVFALGLIFAEDKPTTNEKVKGITSEWMDMFKENFGSLNCKKLKEKHSHSQLGCCPLIVKATELIEKLINKYK